MPGQIVLWSSAAVPIVFYSGAGNGLCVRMQGAVWGIVCLAHLLRNNNNGESFHVLEDFNLFPRLIFVTVQLPPYQPQFIVSVSEVVY